MYDLCTIGHVTLDKIVTTNSTVYLPGGTAYYFTKALQHAPIRQALITHVAFKEQHIITGLRESGIDVKCGYCNYTLFFENTYHDDPDERTQRVLATADAFSINDMGEIKARLFHLGPLLSNDFEKGFLEHLSRMGKISMDVQGMVRTLQHQKVLHTDWREKKELLPLITVLKANEDEMKILTGMSDAADAAKYLAGLGCSEIILTLGSGGSIIYHDDTLYKIPAYDPGHVVDATGCGDTYMAGYLYQRLHNRSIEESGHFGSAMAAAKISWHGPFNAGMDAVSEILEKGLTLK